MPTRQEVAKLGRHLRGLEKYPMSASYPQETGDFEFKKMLQIIKSDCGNKETTVEIQDGSNSLFKKIFFGKLKLKELQLVSVGGEASPHYQNSHKH